jgi:hypothetical protein
MPTWTAAAAPQLQVTPVGIAVEPECGVLHVRWQLANPTAAPLELVDSWLPHGRFFAERQAFQPPLTLPAGARGIVERSVRCVAEPGEVIENAFLILRVRWCGQPWRVLARLRVERLVPDSVVVAVEAVTTQPVGFTRTTPEKEA